MKRVISPAQGPTSVATGATCLSFCLVTTTMSLFGCTEDNASTDALFATADSHLDAADIRAVTAVVESMFPWSVDEQRFEHADCGDIAPVAEVVDLNGDEEYEIFLSWGNACTSGMTGRSLSMLAKDAAGQYQTQLGFPALGWTALPTREQGWPDLSFGGPGFCHAVWAWNGDAYAFKCNLPETEGGCTNPASTC